jgi:hypothetical protein
MDVALLNALEHEILVELGSHGYALLLSARARLRVRAVPRSLATFFLRAR